MGEKQQVVEKGRRDLSKDVGVFDRFVGCVREADRTHLTNPGGVLYLGRTGGAMDPKLVENLTHEQELVRNFWLAQGKPVERVYTSVRAGEQLEGSSKRTDALTVMMVFRTGYDEDTKSVIIRMAPKYVIKKEGESWANAWLNSVPLTTDQIVL